MAAQFSLTPGAATTDVINFATREGMTLHREATKPIGDTLFDMEPDELQTLLNGVQRRATQFGWLADDGMLIIDSDPGDPDSPKCNMITNHHKQLANWFFFGFGKID